MIHYAFTMKRSAKPSPRTHLACIGNHWDALGCYGDPCGSMGAMGTLDAHV